MRCSAARWIRARLGRRGTILLCYGTVWALYGYGQLVSPQPDQRGLRLLLDHVPLDVWAGLWIAAGLCAVASAFAPQGRDWPGFLSLVLMVLPWMGSYAASWVMGEFDRGWVAALIWGVIAVPVIVVAGWRESPRPTRARAEDGH